MHPLWSTAVRDEAMLAYALYTGIGEDSRPPYPRWPTKPLTQHLLSIPPFAGRQFGYLYYRSPPVELNCCATYDGPGSSMKGRIYEAAAPCIQLSDHLDSPIRFCL